MLFSIDSLPITPGARVLLRADLNVPFDGPFGDSVGNGTVADTTRIDRAAATARALCARGAKVILLSHLGRPKNEKQTEYGLERIYPAVMQAFAPLRVHFCPDLIGKKAKEAVDEMQEGEVTLLQNLRFHPGEMSNDPEFIRDLASMGDFFVNDAFSCSHRAHASIVGLATMLPSAAGLLLQEEVAQLESLLSAAAGPVMGIIGGSKISTKIGLLEALLTQVRVLAIGGAMANSFLAAQGHAVGQSLYEPDSLSMARQIIEKAATLQVRLLLPEEVVVAKTLAAGVTHRTCHVDAVLPDESIFDLGAASQQTIINALRTVKTVLWNGPLGAFETPPFDLGTLAVARAIVSLTDTGQIRSIAGGGDSVAALKRAGLQEGFSYLSTAGGAFLEWLEGHDLPGLQQLRTHLYSGPVAIA